MDEITGYFLTTGRVHADEALESLQSQGISRPVVMVRNVRPLYAAHLPTLRCETPYCLVLDDDTVMLPGVVGLLLDRFREKRIKQPQGYKLNGRVFSEAHRNWQVGGLKLFYTPQLRRIGWPDAPHVSFAQDAIARGLGLRVLRCDIKIGTQRRGSDFDVYKKFLWMQIRASAGQLPGFNFNPKNLVAAAQRGQPWMWFAVLGIVDALASAPVTTSKDESYLGPIGRTLNFDDVQAQDIMRILAGRGAIAPTGPAGQPGIAKPA